MREGDEGVKALQALGQELKQPEMEKANTVPNEAQHSALKVQGDDARRKTEALKANKDENDANTDMKPAVTFGGPPKVIDYETGQEI